MHSQSSQTLLINDQPISESDISLPDNEPIHSIQSPSKLFRGIFSRQTKHRNEPVAKEMTNLSTLLIQLNEPNKANGNHKDICLFSDSPHYVVRVGKYVPKNPK